MSKVSDYISNRIEELIDGKECAPIGEYVASVVSEVIDKFENTQCTDTYCGGHDSCGYDLNCYAISFINEDGILEVLDYQEESY